MQPTSSSIEGVAVGTAAHTDNGSRDERSALVHRRAWSFQAARWPARSSCLASAVKPWQLALDDLLPSPTHQPLASAPGCHVLAPLHVDTQNITAPYRTHTTLP